MVLAAYGQIIFPQACTISKRKSWCLYSVASLILVTDFSKLLQIALFSIFRSKNLLPQYSYKQTNREAIGN